MYKKMSVNVIIVKNNKRKRIYTAQEMKKSIIENFIFCAVLQNRNSIKLAIVPENKA